MSSCQDGFHYDLITCSVTKPVENCVTAAALSAGHGCQVQRLAALSGSSAQISAPAFAIYSSGQDLARRFWPQLMGSKYVSNAPQRKVWVLPLLQTVSSFRMCYDNALYLQ